MNKTVLALLGYASAFSCHMKPHHDKHHNCPVSYNKETDPQGEFDYMWTFHRKCTQTGWNAFVKGWYHTSQQMPVDKQCMGDWMDTGKDKMMETVHKLKHGDIWGVSHNDVKEATNDMFDTVFRNLDTCGYYKVYYDNYSYCYNNIGECVFRDGMFDKFINNSFKMAGEAMNLWNFHTELHNAPKCISDEEAFENYATMIEDWAKLWVDFWAIDVKWDQYGPMEELSFKEMHHNMKHAIKEHKHEENLECPVKKFFEEMVDENPAIKSLISDIDPK